VHISKTTEPIFSQEDGKLAAIEKLSLCFLNSFGGGMEVQKGQYLSGPSFTKSDLLIKRESCLILVA